MLGEKNKGIKYTKTVIRKLKNKKVKVSDLIISVQLTKPISKYKVKTPHVSAAKKMKKVKQGTIIKFVITKGKGSISERAYPNGKVSIKSIDEQYYINNQIVPAALRVLGIFGVKKDDLL